MNPIGASRAGGDQQESIEQSNANNANREPDMVVPMPEGSSNDYTGTIDPTLISAAYLACGKVDQAGTEIGCNVYTAEDQRIARVDSLGNWIARAGVGTLSRVDPKRAGVAFAATVPANLRMNRANPKISVSYWFQMAPLSFESNLGSMALIDDLNAFGQGRDFIASGLLPIPRPPTVSVLLSQIQRQGTTADLVRCASRNFTQTNECSSAFGTGSSFNLRRRGIVGIDTIRFTQSNINTTYQTCNSIANLCYAILCR